MYKELMSAITISQQYGSDGYKTAAKLAHRLQWLLLDQEIDRQVAHHLGMMKEEAILYEEHTFNFIERMLLSLRYMTTEIPKDGTNQFTLPAFSKKQEHFYRKTFHQVIENAAQSGNKVIVKQGAQMVLAGRPDIFHVQILASLPQRIQFVMQNEHMNEKDARLYLQRKDQDLERFFHSQYHRHVNESSLYDLIINTTALETESQVDLICRALEHKARWLASFMSEYFCYPNQQHNPLKSELESTSILDAEVYTVGGAEITYQDFQFEPRSTSFIDLRNNA